MQLQTRPNSIQSIDSKLTRAHQVLKNQGVKVYTYPDSRNYFIHYSMYDTYVSYKVDRGEWIVQAQQGEFPDTIVGDIANHLRFWKKLCEI